MRFGQWLKETQTGNDPNTLIKAEGTLFHSSGPLRYSQPNGGYKAIVEADTGIGKYYRSLIPKWIDTNPQKYDAHISVVRNETPINLDLWGKYEGEMIEFTYANHVYNNQTYWWLNVFSKRLEDIRVELGLPVSSQYTLPPSGWIKCFHLTLGNSKGLANV